VYKLLIPFLFIIFQIPAVASHQVAATTVTTTLPGDDINLQARRIIQTIVGVVGLKSNFEIQAAKIPNAAAVVFNGKRYILYNPQFIAVLDKAAGKHWPSIAILAHEIGHHLNGHTLTKNGSLPQTELDADEFSGFVLRKMGASLKDAQLAIQIAGNSRATHTHPAKADRLIAIEKGWQRATNQANGQEDLATYAEPEVPPAVPERKNSTTLADQYIAFDVHFSTEPSSKYFVTNNNNFVKVHNDELLVLGKMTRTGKTTFPLVLFNGDRQVFFVSNDGAIYTDKGRKIGWLNPR
jgi:hypothetical protein